LGGNGAMGGGRMTDDVLMCPNCYHRNLAWSIYAVCPFCGTTGKPASVVVGPEWQKALNGMLRTTGTRIDRAD